MTQKNDSALRTTLPRARRQGLEIQELAGETLVYDLERHRAHSLNEVASLVWRSCNGRTSAETVARRLRHELGLSADTELVHHVVARLGKAHLLDRPAPNEKNEKGYSRRELLQTMHRLGLSAATLLPLVSSIVSPTEAYALSCIEQVDCSAAPDCTLCLNPGGNCNPYWQCCNGQCVPPGTAANQCGCS